MIRTHAVECFERRLRQERSHGLGRWQQVSRATGAHPSLRGGVVTCAIPSPFTSNEAPRIFRIIGGYRRYRLPVFTLGRLFGKRSLQETVSLYSKDSSMLGGVTAALVGCTVTHHLTDDEASRQRLARVPWNGTVQSYSYRTIETPGRVYEQETPSWYEYEYEHCRHDMQGVQQAGRGRGRGSAAAAGAQEHHWRSLCQQHSRLSREKNHRGLTSIKISPSRLWASAVVVVWSAVVMSGVAACHRGASRLAASGLLRSVCAFSTHTPAMSSSTCVDGATESSFSAADMQLCGRGDKRTWRGKVIEHILSSARHCRQQPLVLIIPVPASARTLPGTSIAEVYCGSKHCIALCPCLSY